MNENEEILEYIYQTSNMGMQSTKDLIDSLKGKDNKIKKLIEEIEKNYEKYAKETEKLLNKQDLKAKPIDNYEKTADKKIINLAKSLRKFGEEYIEKLKVYL